MSIASIEICLGKYLTKGKIRVNGMDIPGVRAISVSADVNKITEVTLTFSHPEVKLEVEGALNLEADEPFRAVAMEDSEV